MHMACTWRVSFRKAFGSAAMAIARSLMALAGAVLALGAVAAPNWHGCIDAKAPQIFTQLEIDKFSVPRPCTFPTATSRFL